MTKIETAIIAVALLGCTQSYVRTQAAPFRQQFESVSLARSNGEHVCKQQQRLEAARIELLGSQKRLLERIDTDKNF
jgi:hypothetical protein